MQKVAEQLVGSPSGGWGWGVDPDFKWQGWSKDFLGFEILKKFCEVFFWVALGTFLGFEFCADSITPVTWKPEYPLGVYVAVVVVVAYCAPYTQNVSLFYNRRSDSGESPKMVSRRRQARPLSLPHPSLFFPAHISLCWYPSDQEPIKSEGLVEASKM